MAPRNAECGCWQCKDLLFDRVPVGEEHRAPYPEANTYPVPQTSERIPSKASRGEADDEVQP
jgi:hypothetical protein